MPEDEARPTVSVNMLPLSRHDTIIDPLGHVDVDNLVTRETTRSVARTEALIPR